MRWMNPILGIVLAAQLILAVMLTAAGGGVSATTGGPLLALDNANVDTIVIASDDNRSVKLVKSDGGWQVPAKAGFPAVKQQVSSLLADLRSLQTRLPAATSKAARERFQVAKDRFARRITLKSGDNTLATVYFGESAGPGEVYARLASRDAIHEVRFELWSASADAGEWLVSTYLHRKGAKLARVELPEMTLKFQGNAWQIADLAEGQTTQVNKTANLVSDLSTLPFLSVVGVKQDMDLPEPEFAYTLATKAGEQVTYRFRKRVTPHDKNSNGQQEAGNQKQPGDSGEQQTWGPLWLVTTSASEYVFSIDDDPVARLRRAKRSKLVMSADGRHASNKATASKMAESADQVPDTDKATASQMTESAGPISGNANADTGQGEDKA